MPSRNAGEIVPDSDPEADEIDVDVVLDIPTKVPSIKYIFMELYQCQKSFKQLHLKLFFRILGLKMSDSFWMTIQRKLRNCVQWQLLFAV